MVREDLIRRERERRETTGHEPFEREVTSPSRESETRHQDDVDVGQNLELGAGGIWHIQDSQGQTMTLTLPDAGLDFQVEVLKNIFSRSMVGEWHHMGTDPGQARLGR